MEAAVTLWIGNDGNKSIHLQDERGNRLQIRFNKVEKVGTWLLLYRETKDCRVRTGMANTNRESSSFLTSIGEGRARLYMGRDTHEELIKHLLIWKDAPFQLINRDSHGKPLVMEFGKLASYFK